MTYTIIKNQLRVTNVIIIIVFIINDDNHHPHHHKEHISQTFNLNFLRIGYIKADLKIQATFIEKNRSLLSLNS